MNEKENTLVEMVLAGKLEAFDPLVTPYRRALLSLAFRLTKNWEDAKEVAQETLLRAFKYLSHFDRKRSFKNWLFQILVNAARNFQKKSLPLAGGFDLEELAASNSGPDGRHLREELKSQLLECLTGLSRKEKEIFLLRDIEELSIKETAEVLGVSSISVRVHLSAARKKIKEMIQEKYPHMMEGRR
jgi:RNA polymerase sigma-70 factor (ECF subfamily)